MADSEGTETVQMEDATKSLEKDQPEPMDEEQSIGILLAIYFPFTPQFRAFVAAF
jgi:hypothetical protein